MNTLGEVQSWVRAAIIDNWKVTSPMRNDRVMRLERDGFIALATMRERDPKLHVWGPDTLAIKPPSVYSFRDCSLALRRCERCPDYVGVTERAGFSNRVCPSCAKEMGDWTEEITSD